MAGDRASPYGSGPQQAGLYPSPYQSRHRLHSKHRSRGYKRRADSSEGSDGVPAVYGAPSGSGVGLALSSASTHSRARNERDRFLVDINGGGQRNGAPNTLLHARQEPVGAGDNVGSGSAGGSIWLPSSSHRSTRLSGSGRPAMAPPQRNGGIHSGYGIGGNRTPAGRAGSSRGGDSTVVGDGVRGGGMAESFGVGGGRRSIPQRYTRSRERLDGSGSTGAGGDGGLAGGVRPAGGRHRGHGGGGTVGESSGGPTGKLPSISTGGGGPGGAGVNHGFSGGGRATCQQKIQQFGAERELVVRTDGCETSGTYTIQGHKPGNARWENQDNYVMEEKLGGVAVRLFVVLDGHGELGHLVSRRCAELLPKIVMDSGLSVARAMLKMSDDLRTCAVDCASSGATCVMTIIRGGKISVANLGDSKCVLARLVNGQLCAVPLSDDHKPDRTDERQRILAIGGQVGSRHLVVGSSPSGPIRIPMGPARVWYRCRGEIMGLAMSRSLGDDIAHQAGVSSEPEVMEHDIDASDQFLILATDGVWDVTEIGQAVQLVQELSGLMFDWYSENNTKNTKGNRIHILRRRQTSWCPPVHSQEGYAARCRGNSWDPQGAASFLAHTARKRWEGLSAVVDDITAMVVKLNSA